MNVNVGQDDLAASIRAMSDELAGWSTKWKREDALFINKLQGALTDFRRAERGFGTFDPDLDAPLSVEQIVCLPELGGELFYSVDMSVPSPAVAVKAVRAAIKENKLGLVSWNANHQSTRRLVREWLASCVTAAGSVQAPRRAAKPIKNILSKPKVVVEEQFEERDIAKSAASISLAKMMKKKGG